MFFRAAQDHSELACVDARERAIQVRRFGQFEMSTVQTLVEDAEAVVIEPENLQPVAPLAREDEQRALQVPDRAPTVEQELVARSRAEMIVKAIHALPEKQRTALLMCRHEEFSYEEIARVVGCSLSATKSLIHRARETLKERLKPYLRSGAWGEE